MSSWSAACHAFARFWGGARAHLALEAGERGARLLLVRRAGRSIRVQRVLSADLRADALLSPGEMAARVRSLLAEFPPVPATLVLPPGRMHSQLMGLRPGESRAVADLARAVGGRQFEAVPSIFDARPLRPTVRHARPMWVSIAREADVEIHLLRCGIPAERVAGVIGADAALAAAFSTLPERERPATAVLLEFGVSSGLLVVVDEGRPVFASDFDFGIDHPAAALALDLGCTQAAAEVILARDGMDAVGPATPRLGASLQGLRQTVGLLLQDCAREAGRPAAELLAAPCWLSGAGLDSESLAGLLAGALGAEKTRVWPAIATEDGGVLRLSAAAVAYGTAAVALGLADAPPNLAPPATRAARRAEGWVGALQGAGLALALAGLGLAVFALHARSAALRLRESEASALRAARDAVPAVLAARKERDDAYLAATPALYLQKRTRDFVTGARLLREQRGSGDFWFALVTDVETYQAGSLPQGTPAAAPETQLLAGCLARPSGLVVELSFRPGGGDPLAQVGALITELRAASHFASVDILPARARQTALADRSVFAAAGADYALQLDATPFSDAGPPEISGTGAAKPGLFQSTP